MLSIIIPVYDAWSLTRRCLQTLLHGSSGTERFTVVIVDHGVTDTVERGLAEEFPEVVHLRADSSLWWAGAVNHGIRFALSKGADFIMLLNHDCLLAGSTVATLLEHARRMQHAVIAPVQRSLETNAIISLRPRELLLLGFPVLIGPRRITERMRESKIITTPMIGGGRGVIIPASVFKTVGLFDAERFPHYYADHDFYLRCRTRKIPLYTAVDVEVLVDEGCTSLASRPGRMSWRDFVDSLYERRSHRNLRDLWMLFRVHYPVRHLAWLGFSLSAGRYLLIYLLNRGWTILAERVLIQRK